jgi:site-specific DNA-methyltransferase (adenine-specific)
MKPYYEHAGITIYHGDCREIIGLLDYSAVITDPPYGTGFARGGGNVGEFVAHHEKPEWDVFDASWIEKVIARAVAIFCPLSRVRDLLSVKKSAAVLHYKKTNPRPLGPNREAIVVWPAPYQMNSWEFSAYNGDTPFHPTQKPTEVMAWLISGICESTETICDPHMGSGSTLVAAKKLGHPAIGIEIEEKYCEIAAKRLSQEVFEW